MTGDTPTPHNRLRWLAPVWATLGAVALIALVAGSWALAFAATMTLVLCLAPVVLASRYRIVLPLPFVISITVFIIASLILGEVMDAYERLWWWDIALHGSSAIALGMIGFLFIYMLFHGDKFAAPPFAVAFFAYTFAASLGGLWEIFEYTVDTIAATNMQKSGLDDTMWDLIVGHIGAALGASVGYGYLKGQSIGLPGRLIADFVALNRHLYAKAKQQKKK